MTDPIQQSLDYIENNLKAPITAEELSAMAHFSLYHYYRLFETATGLPVMQYITRRRLLWAAWEMANGKKVIDAALAYGFDTSAGFYKAFRREFAMPPSAFAKRFRIRKPTPIRLLEEEHIMLSTKKIKHILSHWSLQEENVRPVVHEGSGFISENAFHVGEQYVIKAYANLGALHLNAQIAQALAQHGLASALHIPTQDGKACVAEGDLYFALMHRVSGEHPQARALLADESLTHHLGQMLAALHQALDAHDQLPCRTQDIFDEVRSQWLAPAKAVLDLPEAFCREYLAAIERLAGQLPVQIIHRDPNPGNIILQQGKLAGFIDFDLSQRSFRIFDPCYAATAILCEVMDKATQEDLVRWPAAYRAIIRGYDSRCPLSPAEKEALPWMVLSIQLICVGYLSGIDKMRGLLDTNIRMVRYLMKHMDELSVS